jgi:hypothetical protein
MSEYQYYEFRCIDKPLTAKEQKEIGRWSSRTHPTSTGAIFIYNYGDFPKDEKRVVEQYFDAMFYIANWGTKRLIFKFPKELMNIDSIKPYCTSEEISISESGQHLLLDFYLSDEEGYGWIDGEGWLASLIGLRNDILHGDYRSLYLAWLHACSLQRDWEDFNKDESEPPVPAHLDTLNGALKSLTELFDMDKDILGVATKASGQEADEPEFNIESSIQHLLEIEKNDFLVKLAKGEPLLSVRLLNRLKELSKPSEQVPSKVSDRTIGNILSEADRLKKRRKDAARRKREADRLKKLAKLEANASTLWEEVYRHISEKKPQAYDVAITILQDLYMLAKHQKKQDEYEHHIRKILQEYSRLPSLKSKIIHAKLIRNL